MREITYRQAIYEALHEEMERDRSVVILGEDVGVYGGAFGVTKDLWQKFGKQRVINTPISENSFVGIATGLAMNGMRPVVEIMFMDFLTLAVDQIVNHATKLHYMYAGQVKIPMVIRTPAGAGRGYGASHSQSLEQLFLGVPGIKIVAPATPYDAKSLLKASIEDNNVVLFIESKLLYDKKGEVPEDDYRVPMGKAFVRREGKDVTIISYSRMVDIASEAAGRLAEDGVEAEVVDLRTLRPLDIDTVISSVKKTGSLVFVEEGHKIGGIGAEVCSIVAENCLEYLNGRIVRLGSADVPIPSSTFLEQQLLPKVEDVVEAAMKSITWNQAGLNSG